MPIIAVALAIIIILGLKLYSLSKVKPNIILITFDSLRADHLGCYGYTKDTSPFLDSLSKEALIFTNCIAQSGSTVPAISALFTSRFPYLDSVVVEGDLQGELGGRYLTIAEFLKDLEYDTLAIPGHYYVKKKFGFSRGFNYYNDNYNNRINAQETLMRVINLFKDKIIKKSFFLWIHFREPHTPYSPPREYVLQFSEPLNPTWHKDGVYVLSGENQKLTGRDINKFISGYDGNIRYADDKLREIFGYLNKKGILRKSIIIITADHAESLGAHGIFDHGFLYYGILRVPLIIKIPGYRGDKITYPVSSVDIFPTIIGLLKGNKYLSRLNLRGKSLLGERNMDEAQFSEVPGSYSVIKNGWRVSLNLLNGEKKLFNVVLGPEEEKDLISEYPDIFQSLFYELEKIRASASNLPRPSTDVKSTLSKEDVEQLRALGYAN